MFVVVVWSFGYHRGATTYEDGIFGPFRSEERAERRATLIREAIERFDWDEKGDKPEGVEVRQLNPGNTPLRDAMIGHLVPDIGA